MSEFDTAFPIITNNVLLERGMSLRDYFAAKAMGSLIAVRCYPHDNNVGVIAYQIADKMMEAREK